MYLKDEAAFHLKDFLIESCSLEFNYDGELDLELNPEGKFYSKDSSVEVIIDFNAKKKDTDITVIECRLVGYYQFKENIQFAEIPEYFHNNSLAILYPYLRSFVSNLTLQSNRKLLVLPTMNLSKVGKEFKENFIVIDNE